MGSARAEGHNLAYGKAWLNLLHYEKSFGHFKSEADGSGFFLSPRGKTDPQGELSATVEALQDIQKLHGRIKAPAACVFPARKKFLERHGHIFPSVNCPDYESWRKGLPVTHLSLIFATAYPNNPASMFGHTFLRLNGPGEGRDLLDYAVNFAATTGTDGGIEFALFGLFGGYEGHYSLAPYFIKVNEYNHGEARDLWEYPLDLSPGSVDMLLAHLWEIEATTHFDYYFVDENCSWQILRLLEAADPGLDLTSSADLYVIPGDTVKAMAKKGLLKEPVFRPSLRLKYLSMGNPKSDKGQLDKLLLHFRLKTRLGKNSPEDQAQYHASLIKRAKDPDPSPEPSVPPAQNRPDLGHGLRRLTFTQGNGFRRLGMRLAQHDLLDHDLGHESWSALDVLRTTVEEEKGQLFVREVTLVDAVSLHPWDGLAFEPSWYLRVSAETPREFACRRCFTPSLRMGLGQSFQPNEHLIMALFIGPRACGRTEGHRGIDAGMSLRGLVGIGYGRTKFLWDAERIWDFRNDSAPLMEFSLSHSVNDAWAVRMSLAKLFNNQDESSFSLLYYY